MRLPIVLCLLAASCAPSAGRTYERQREQFVLVQAALERPADTIVLGDSIVETNVLDGLCGKTFAAGIGGAMIGDMQRLAPELIKRSAAKLAVLAIGTNDVIDKTPDFDARYGELLYSLPMKPFALVGVKNGDNAFIASEAKRIGAIYVPPVPLNMTRDGVHPNPVGAKLWRNEVAAACPKSGTQSSG